MNTVMQTVMLYTVLQHGSDSGVISRTVTVPGVNDAPRPHEGSICSDTRTHFFC